MKILFAPSEAKQNGGEHKAFSQDALCCQDLFENRLEVVQRYEEFKKSASIEALSKLFGLKKAEEIEHYKALNLFEAPTMKAIMRYSGVAFEYLDYSSLKQEDQSFLDENVIIFSNLFGPILARDTIPEYKLKQGEKMADFDIAKHYKDSFSQTLDAMLQNEDVLDLRSGYYTKFYDPKFQVTTMKFLKNGRVVSHWAKAYRGLVLRHIAQGRFQTLQELLKSDIQGLSLLEIQETKRKKEILFEVIE